MDDRQRQSEETKERNRRTFTVIAVENGYITKEGDTGKQKVFHTLEEVVTLLKDFYRVQEVDELTWRRMPG